MYNMACSDLVASSMIHPGRWKTAVSDPDQTPEGVVPQSHQRYSTLECGLFYVSVNFAGSWKPLWKVVAGSVSLFILVLSGCGRPWSRQKTSKLFPRLETSWSGMFWLSRCRCPSTDQTGAGVLVRSWKWRTSRLLASLSSTLPVLPLFV